jgi:hypothetical protein
MSEQCKYDEQVLDYLYGELAEAERAAFAAHLAGCESCRREIDSLSGVRKKAAELPRPVLQADAAARMTAQLMEAAIAATKAQSASAAMGGGKLVPFRSGRLRRALTHPVSAGLMVAAAALFIVIFRLREPTQPVSDSPVPTPAVEQLAKVPPKATAAAAPAGATTQVPLVTVSPDGKTALLAPKEEAKPSATPRPDTLKAGYRETKLADSTTRAIDGAGSAASAPSTVATSLGPSSSGGKKPMAWGPAPTTPPEAKPSPVFAKNDRVETAKSEAMDERRFAAPPPPIAEPSAAPVAVAQAAPAQAAPAQAASGAAPASRGKAVSEEADNTQGIVAQTKARQHQRTMDELERGELAQAPTPSVGDSEGNARRQASVSSLGRAGGSVGHSKDAPSDEDVAGSSANQAAAADKVAEKSADRAGPLTQVYEQIRSGRCVEARELLQKIERSFPGTAGLADANSTWQRDCGLRLQLQNREQQNYQNLQQQNYQNLQQPTLPPRGNYAPAMPSPAAAAPRLERAPMESNLRDSQFNEARRAMAKKASPPAPVMKAPAKAKAAPAKAVDAAF